MSEPHKHHYVPKFYQRGFMADGETKIWVYQQGLGPRRCSTRKTGMTIDFYSFSNSRGVVDFGTVERQLARLDDQAAKIIQRLVQGKKLLERERMRLARFVSVMWRRTPKHREQVNKVAKEMVPGILRSS